MTLDFLTNCSQCLSASASYSQGSSSVSSSSAMVSSDSKSSSLQEHFKDPVKREAAHIQTLNHQATHAPSVATQLCACTLHCSLTLQQAALQSSGISRELQKKRTAKECMVTWTSWRPEASCTGHMPQLKRRL